jgi:ankyrin repeat protein
MVNLLLQQGAETLFSDSSDRTILHYACIVGVSKSILQLLIDYNDDITSKGTHLEEANNELVMRKQNVYDLPKGGGRPMRISLLPGLGMMQDESKADSRYSMMQRIPHQPLTSSAVPIKDKELDITKIRKS